MGHRTPTLKTLCGLHADFMRILCGMFAELDGASLTCPTPFAQRLGLTLLMQRRSPYDRHCLAARAFRGAPGSSLLLHWRAVPSITRTSTISSAFSIFERIAPAKKKRRLLNNMATDKDAEQSLRDVGLRANIYGQCLTRDGSVLVSRPPSPLTSMLE